MSSRKCLSILVLANLLAAFSPAAATAQEWRADGARAGFAVSGRLAGLVFECAPGGALRTVVAGNGARFPEERDMTLVLSVDGVARLSSVRAEPDPSGGSRFVRLDPKAEIEPLLAALRRGRVLEVSSPAGTTTLPLKGSERALTQLLARCAG